MFFLLKSRKSILVFPSFKQFLTIPGDIFISGRDVFSQSAPGTSVNSIQPMNPTQTLMYRQACFSILVYVPIVCASVQIVTWSFYKLHGTKLKQISSLRANIPSFLTV